MADRKKYGLSLYGAMLIKNIQESAAYKLDFIIGILAHLLMQASTVFMILVVYSHTETVGGWDFYQSLVLYGCSLLPAGIEEFCLHNVWSLGKHVNMGTMDSILLRPVSPLKLLIMDGTGIHGFVLEFVGILMVVIGFAQGGISFNAWKCVWLILCAVSGAVIIFAINLFVATLSFWFTDVMNAMVMVDSLRQFVKYPITIYQPFIRGLLCIFIPYAFTSFFPAALMLDMESYAVWAYMTPGIAFVMSLMATKFFYFGLRFYKSSGGRQ